MPPGTPGEVQPPAEPVAPWPAQPQGFRSPIQYDWRAGWRSAITVGVVIGIFSFAPYIGGPQFCCFWSIAGGTGAALLYCRNADRSVIPVSVGFRTGILTGLVAYAVNALAVVAALVVKGSSQLRIEMAEELRTRSLALSNTDQVLAKRMEPFIHWFLTPEGFAWSVTLSLVMLGIGFVLFTGLGGAIGASILRRNRQ